MRETEQREFIDNIFYTVGFEKKKSKKRNNQIL